MATLQLDITTKQAQLLRSRRNAVDRAMEAAQVTFEAVLAGFSDDEVPPGAAVQDVSVDPPYILLAYEEPDDDGNS